MPNSIVNYFRAFWFWWLWPLASSPWRPKIRKLLSNTSASMESIHRGTNTEPLPSTESVLTRTAATRQLPLTPDIIHHRITQTASLVSTDSPSIRLTLHLSAVGSIPICTLSIFTITMPFLISVPNPPLLPLLLLLLPLLRLRLLLLEDVSQYLSNIFFNLEKEKNYE